MKYVIIGNSAAAMGAVEGIRKHDENNPITIISQEKHHTYSRPLISYYLAGKVLEENMYYRPLDFYRKNKVEVLYQGAKGVNTNQKEVILEDTTPVPYDKLLIATGGKPFIPPMEGLGKEGIYTFQKWDDVKAIEKALTNKTKAVIIGAGLIGMKGAEALTYLGIDVTVVELAKGVLSSVLDEYSGELVKEVMESQGINFIFENTVKQILGEGKVQSVLLSSGQELECDLLIIAIGVVPNMDVVRNTTLEVNRGIIVDKNMMTSMEDVFAAGDVSEGEDTLLHSKRVIPILPNAFKQGEVAGENMTGKNVVFAGGFPMNSIGFFGYPLITAGIYNTPGQGPCEEISISHPQDKVYRKIFLKDNKLMGFIALKDIDRVGMLTSLIKEGICVDSFKEQLCKADLGYIDWPKELRRERMLGGGGA